MINIELANYPKIDLSVTPHLLITGTSGSGKTNFLLNSLISIRKHNEHANIILLDFKNELKAFESLYDKYINIIDEKQIDVLLELYYIFLKSNNFSLPPTILVIEEGAGLYNHLSINHSKKVAEKYLALLSNIASTGRSKNLQLIFTTQRPDTSIITGETRGNISNKVVLNNGISDIKQHLIMSYGEIGSAFHTNILSHRNLQKGEAIINLNCSLHDLEDWEENLDYTFVEINGFKKLNHKSIFHIPLNMHFIETISKIDEAKNDKLFLEYYDLLFQL